MAMKADGGRSQIRRVIERVDRHAYVRTDEDGKERFDAGWSASNNWEAAKLNFTISAGTGLFTGLATLDYYAPNLIGPEWPAAALAVVFGTATAGSVALGVKNTIEAGVWGVIAGAQRLFGGRSGAPL